MPVKRSMFLALIGLSLALPAGADVLERDCQILVDAIKRANAGETVEVALDANAIYLLNGAEPRKRALPLLRGTLEIDGRGASVRGYPGMSEPLFHVAPGARLRLRDMTLSEAAAGTVLNHGHTELAGLTMEDNAVVRARAMIVNHGSLILESSDLRHNLVRAGQREAGTVANYGDMKVIDSVFHDNAIDRSVSTVVVAGSILNRGRLQVESVAVLGNRPSDEPDRRGYGEIVDLGYGVTLGDTATGLVRSGADLAEPAPSTDDTVQVRSRP